MIINFGFCYSSDCFLLKFYNSRNIFGRSTINNIYTIQQSWARVFKITLRLAPVRLFQTVSQKKKIF